MNGVKPKVRRSAVAVAAALIVHLPAVTAAQPAGSAEGRVDTAAVKAAVHAFHDALAAGDSARALDLLHLEVRVFEGGHAETRSEYESGHLGADMAFSAAVDRELLWESVSGAAGRALYLSEYRMTGTFRGRGIDAHGVETMVLVRTPEGWRIRHIHWSSR